jgi:hypothetical protein
LYLPTYLPRPRGEIKAYVTNEVVRMRALNYFEEILKERRERKREIK